MSETPESVVRRFLAGGDSVNPEEQAAFFAEDGIFIDGPRGEIRGAQAIRDEFQNMATMLANLSNDIKMLVTDGNCVMVERVEAVEVQGHPCEIASVAVFEFDDERRITRLRDYYDLQSVMEQLNVALSPQN